MPNKNYLKGVRLERKAKAELEAQGYHVTRASGSHGLYDLIAVHPDYPVRLIQIKTSKSSSKLDRMLRAFLKKPPLERAAMEYYRQEMWVWFDKTWWMESTI